MKKIILIFAASLFASFSLFSNDLPQNERCITETEGSPFSVSPLGDGIAIGVLGATALTSYLLPKIVNMPEYYEFSYNLDNVNPLDRKFARKYSRDIDHLGDLSVAFSYCLVPAVFGAQWFSDNLETKEGLKIAAMYAETVLATQTAKCLLKTAIKRKRPYMYFDGYPADELEDYDFEFSLPSGHTTDAFMNAAFLSYTFCKYYPESNFKIPVIASAYSVAAVTAGLRVGSGNHFVTDTIAGAALGSAIGFAIPWLHTLSNRISTDKTQVSLMPTAVNLKIQL